MKHQILPVAALLSLAIIMPDRAGAALQGTGEGMIEGKLVSAYVKFDIVDGKLQITLTNTGTSDEYSAAHVLTDISFNMDGVDFAVAGSKVVVGPGGELSYQDSSKQREAAGFDVSAEWGLARNVILASEAGDPIGPFAFCVTATSPLEYGGEEFEAEPFAAGSLGGPPRLDGADFGLINPESRNHNGIKNMDMILSSVVITLSPVDGLLSESDLARISGATFSFGSDHVGIVGIRDAVIPEPVSLIVWGLLGSLAVIACRLGRR